MKIVSHDQRIYISDRRDSTGHRLRKMCLTQPLPPVMSDDQVVGEYCRQSVERLGETHLCKMMVVAVPSITNIYSLDNAQPDFEFLTHCEIRSIRQIGG